MTDEGQTGLADFGPDGDDADADRPEAEAVYVAGDEGDAEVVDPTTATLPDADGTVEMTVTQVDYTVAGYGDEEEPLVHVFGRREDRTGEHVVVRGFEPYFYAPSDTVDEESLATRDRVTGYEEGYESIRGEQLTKIFGQTPRDVGQMRDDFQHYEADVLFPNRFLIDKDVGAGVSVPNRRLEDGRILVDHEEVEPTEASEVPPRMNVFDIEVDDRSGFPEEGEEPIVCLTSHDSYRDEYVVWLFEAPDGDGAIPEELGDYDPLDDDADYRVEAFDTEEAMLDAFLDYVEETDPDVLSGWNCLPADSSILMADGSTREIEDVEIGDRVVGSEDQHTTTATVTNKWESEKEVLEFSLADGTTMEASGEHRVMIGDDERVDWKQGDEIEPGDFVLKPRTLNVDDPEVPTLSELIPRSHQRYDDPTIREFKDELPYGAVTELAEEFDVGKETLYHPWPSTWTPKRCERAAREFDVPLPDGGTVYRGSDTELDRQITEHEMYLAGLVLADGSLSTSGGIRFYNKRKELHRQFPGDNALTEDRIGCYKQNVLDYVRLHAFNGLGIPFGNKNEDDVDLSSVFRMPESHIGQFLAGVIDGDGCVSNGRLSVAAQNDSIAEWYSKLFKRIGVYNSQQQGKIFVPTTERSLSRLEAKVVPHMSHSEKIERLRSVEGGTSNRSENIPYALFEAEPGTDERRIGEDKQRRGINLKRHESTTTEWGEYVFVRVDEIDTVGTETTYDIETTTHNFIADDCLVHNCDDFDIPYTLDRLEVLQGPGHDHDLSIDRLSRVDEVWRGGWGGPDVKGRVVFDLLRAYKRTQFSELESYRLDAVGEAELGVGKERYAGDIGDLWEDDPERLLEYNLRDVELCVELDRKQDIVQFWMEVKAFVGCLLEDAPTPGDAVDMYVMHEAHDQFVLPSKGQQEAGEEFEGGAVFEPITGVREMISVLDLKSLYPMSMATINASPETKVDPDLYDGDTYTSPDGTHFRKEPDGMMREMIDALLSERERKKEQRNEFDPDTPEYKRYDQQQAAVKRVMNSLYGVSGWEQFRLYDKDAAAAITATGRSVIEFTEEVASGMNYQVAYGDTDSVMLELGQDVTTQEAIDASFDIEEAINDRYDDYALEELNAASHRFQIEFEKLYRRFFQAGKKKRYAGHIVWKEGKDVDDVDITGFEYQRSDIAGITKEVQHRVIELLVREGDVEGVKEYVHDTIAEFKEGNLPLDEVGIPGGIGKKLDAYETDTAQVRGAKYANVMLGTNFASGSKPMRLYVESVHPDFWRRMEDERGLNPGGGSREDRIYREFKRDPDVICFEYADQVPEEFDVDWDKMLEKTLKGPIARILEALDVSWDEVETGQEQTGLGNFM